jgi:hypothetical protein
MTAESTPIGPRIVAKFRPQAWINDYAVDVDGGYDFDATELLLSWPWAQIMAIEDHSYTADAVWQDHYISIEHPHNGPFEVEVTASLLAFLDAVGAEYVWGETPTYQVVKS